MQIVDNIKTGIVSGFKSAVDPALAWLTGFCVRARSMDSPMGDQFCVPYQRFLSQQ